jgi:hypothetical protein
LPGSFVSFTISIPCTIIIKKEISSFKNVFSPCFQIVLIGYLDTDRDTDSYTVKRKSEAWGGDMLLTQKMCRAEREWCICNKTGRQEGGVREKVGRVPNRG